MANGIIAKVWNIKGESVKKNTSSQLKDSIGYILNGEKINGTLEMELAGQIERECKYVGNDVKTMSGAYVGGRNLVSTEIRDAVKEMMEVKKFYEKTSGRAALHGVISLPEIESDPRNASRLMQLCDAVMKEVFPNNQAIYGVHMNTENLHIHFIVNSVGLDGKKIYQDKHFIKRVLHPCINKYAEQFGFTPNEKWNKEYQESVKSIKSIADIKIMVRSTIDRAIENSSDFTEFVSNMKVAGYETHVGKYISVKNDEMEKAFRTHQLGTQYTKDSIVERIATRKQAFATLHTGNYSIGEEIQDIFVPTNRKLQKYKDMSPTQKEYVIKQLRLGNNPWREHMQRNWQLNNIAEEINLQNRVLKYMEHYSSDRTLEGTLTGILEAKKRIASEKKVIREQLQKYKPIIDIYKEMQLYEKKAYLYEHEGKSEYRLDYERYRTLTRRLKSGYDKEAPEVAEFLAECDERILFANAQLEELSLQYREVKKYSISVGVYVDKSKSVIDEIGIFDNSKQKGVSGNWYYLASVKSDVIFQVLETPEVKNGRVVQGYTITVLSQKGEVLDEIKNSDGNKDFAAQVRSLEAKYNMRDCNRYTDIGLAREFAATVHQEEDMHVVEALEESFGFTQAINHGTERKMCVIADTTMAAYYAISSVRDGALRIIVFDRNGSIAETVSVPYVKKASKEGYEIIMDIQKKYGFSDKVRTFDTVDAARDYMETQTGRTNETEKRRREEWRM